MPGDSPLEEVFHLVTDTGFAHAYPEVFATKVGSNLTAAMTLGFGYRVEALNPKP